VPEFIGADIDETYLDEAVLRIREGAKKPMVKAELRAEKRAARVAGGSGRPGR
jgi:hypothetical protein